MHNYASFIDHTLLSPQATGPDIKELCREAVENNFKSVCVPPHFVSIAKNYLKESEVLVCTVIGFPLGYTTSKVKAFETHEAIEDGADEIDMVINNCLLKENQLELVTADISGVVEAAQGRVVKVILETCLLDSSQIEKACKCCDRAGAHFVKTSTGFSSHGATVEAVEVMKASISPQVKIKASGGIRDYIKAKLMIESGASRLGTSASLAIIEKKKKAISKDQY